MLLERCKVCAKVRGERSVHSEQPINNQIAEHLIGKYFNQVHPHPMRVRSTECSLLFLNRRMPLIVILMNYVVGCRMLAALGLVEDSSVILVASMLVSPMMVMIRLVFPSELDR
jgi:hypothetical protein